MKLNEVIAPGYILDAQVLDETHLSFLFVLHNGQIVVSSPSEATSRVVCELPVTMELEQLKTYVYRSYVAVVENSRQRGLVINLEDPSFRMDLYRKDYQVEHCSFPIAFYSAQDQTFLIHGTDWNRLDITCLDTGELLTARTIQSDTKTNFFDYFHSELMVSPDHQRFLSNGWIWAPVDILTVYEISDFFQRYELCYRDLEMPITSGYLWDRAVAWLDAHTLAVVYNQQEETGEEKFPSELLFLDVATGDLKDRIPFDHFKVCEEGEIFDDFYYSASLKVFIILGQHQGMKMVNLTGELLHTEEEMEWRGYSELHQLVYGWKKDKLWYGQLIR
jgi:hypothetical protein